MYEKRDWSSGSLRGSVQADMSCDRSPEAAAVGWLSGANMMRSGPKGKAARGIAD
jgi:hypothetical protein